MTDSKCAFCRALSEHKEIHKMLAKRAKQERPELGAYRAEYAVALIESTWYEKYGKRSAGRMTDYRHRGLGYKLRYCPECGRKL